MRRVLETLVYDPAHVTDELVDERWAILQEQPPEVLSRMIIPNMESELGGIRCPVLSFWGAGRRNAARQRRPQDHPGLQAQPPR